MHATAVSQPTHPIVENDLPGGIWDALRQAADMQPSTPRGFWRDLEDRTSLNAPPTEIDIWQSLMTRSDPTNYCPRVIPNVVEEQVQEGDQSFTVIRSPRGN